MPPILIFSPDGEMERPRDGGPERRREGEKERRREGDWETERRRDEEIDGEHNMAPICYLGGASGSQSLPRTRPSLSPRPICAKLRLPSTLAITSQPRPWRVARFSL